MCAANGLRDIPQDLLPNLLVRALSFRCAQLIFMISLFSLFLFLLEEKCGLLNQIASSTICVRVRLNIKISFAHPGMRKMLYVTVVSNQYYSTPSTFISDLCKRSQFSGKFNLYIILRAQLMNF